MRWRPSTRDIARVEKERAEMGAYRLAIEKADKLSATGCCSDALQILDATAPSCRGWEYGHLRCRAERNTYRKLLSLPGRGQCLALSSAGTRLALARDGKTVSIMDAATGRELRSCAGHTNQILLLCFLTGWYALGLGRRKSMGLRLGYLGPALRRANVGDGDGQGTARSR